MYKGRVGEVELEVWHVVRQHCWIHLPVGRIGTRSLRWVDNIDTGACDMLASEAGAVGVDVGGRLGEHRELEEEGLSGFRAVFTFPG